MNSSIVVGQITGGGNQSFDETNAIAHWYWQGSALYLKSMEKNNQQLEWDFLDILKGNWCLKTSENIWKHPNTHKKKAHLQHNESWVLNDRSKYETRNCWGVVSNRQWRLSQLPTKQHIDCCRRRSNLGQISTPLEQTKDEHCLERRNDLFVWAKECFGRAINERTNCWKC